MEESEVREQMRTKHMTREDARTKPIALYAVRKQRYRDGSVRVVQV